MSIGDLPQEEQTNMAFDAGKFNQINFKGVRNNTPVKTNQVKGEVDPKTLAQDPVESFQFGDAPLIDVKAESAVSSGQATSEQKPASSSTPAAFSAVSNSPMILQGDGLDIGGLSAVNSINSGNGVQPQTTVFTNKVGDPTIVSSSGNILASNNIFSPVTGSSRVPNTSLDAINSTFEMTEIRTIGGRVAGVSSVPTTSLDALNGLESRELAYVGSSSVY